MNPLVAFRLNTTQRRALETEATKRAMKPNEYARALVVTMLEPDDKPGRTPKGFRSRINPQCPHPPRMRVNGNMPQCLACGEMLSKAVNSEG